MLVCLIIANIKVDVLKKTTILEENFARGTSYSPKKTNFVFSSLQNALKFDGICLSHIGLYTDEV